MMANPDVIVNITDAIAETSTVDLGLILIVSTDAVKDYKEYDLSGGITSSGIEDDYPSTTNTYRKAATIAKQTPSPRKLAIIGCSSGVILEDDLIERLNTLLVEHDSFFRILVTSEVGTIKLAVAKWAADNKKFAYIQYDNTTFTEDYTSTPARLLLHKVADEHLDAAESGYASNLVPGTFTFKFKGYNGITPDTLTATEISQAETKNMGYYIKVSGLNMQRNSKASNYSDGKPLYIDDLESRIYTEESIKSRLLSVLTTNNKVPGDVNGLQMIEDTLNQVLNNNYNLGIIASMDNGNPDFSVDTTLAEFIKSTREWRGIKFKYTYLHPTEKITVTGTVS